MKMFRHAGIALLGSLLALSGCGETDLLSIRDTTLIGDTANVAGPYVIETFATDDSAVKRVKLHYAVNGATSSALEMLEVTDGHYRAEIPGQPIGSRVTYFVDAKDDEGNRVNDPAAAPSRPRPPSSPAAPGAGTPQPAGAPDQGIVGAAGTPAVNLPRAPMQQVFVKG